MGEQRENETSSRMIQNEFGLPPDVSRSIMEKVGPPTGKRTNRLDISTSQRSQIERQHETRNQLREGVRAFEGRVDGYMNDMANSSVEKKWDELTPLSAKEVKQLHDQN